MEAPEKIYLEKIYPDNGVLPNGLNYNQSINDIEYVRKDAFIEKAEKWLDEHILDYVYSKNWGQGVGVEGELFDDFKNYMKGE